MAEQRPKQQPFPDLPAKSYCDLRRRFQSAPPTQVTASYLASVLNVSLKTGQNILPQVRALGLIDEQGRVTELGHDWRLDDQYSGAVEQIRHRTYPQELRELFPCAAPDVDGVSRWMARRLNVGTSRATNMARIYVVLCQKNLQQPVDRPRGNATGQQTALSSRKLREPSGSAATEQFPLPRSGLKVLRLILIGYLHQGGRDRKSVGPSSIGSAVGMDQTLVSRNNAFLAAVGLIESESRGRWRLTDSGIIVAQAFEYDAAEELQIALSSTLRANDFIQGILTLVRTRGGVEESQLVPQIARMAGTPRKTEFLTGSRTLLELMLAAGLVVIEGGVFRLGSRPESRTGWIDEPGADDTTQSAEPALSRTSAIARTAHVVINLNLSADDLESDERVQALTARIRRLLDSVEQMSREDAD